MCIASVGEANSRRQMLLVAAIKYDNSKLKRVCSSDGLAGGGLFFGVDEVFIPTQICEQYHKLIIKGLPPISHKTRL